MLLLHLVMWCSYIVMFCIATLSLACGLYYLADFAEEHTILTGKILRWTIYVRDDGDGGDTIGCTGVARWVVAV